MNFYEYPSQKEWASISKRPTIDWDLIAVSVKSILQKVKIEGDKAIQTYTEQFDGVKLLDFKVQDHEIEESKAFVPQKLKEAISVAARNIYKFHDFQRQKLKPICIEEGIECWQKQVAIENIGLYIPAGSAPLFSTVLMLGIPALIAGCSNISIFVPPNSKGKIHHSILYTANLLGLNTIFKIGGAQAIASMTYGTASVSKVNKIFGPGNQYVTVAKQLVSLENVAIDMPAGPSEVLVFADKTANPNFIASDLLAQAEHSGDSQVLLITTYPPLVDLVQKAIEEQIKTLPRQAIARQALENSSIVLVHKTEDALSFINDYAPEHLILMLENTQHVEDKIINAGSVFLGHYTPEAVGDYISGTNHVLPTNGFAKMYSGVSLASFYKTITFQKVSQTGLQKLGTHAEHMASEESLKGHKESISIRLKAI